MTLKELREAALRLPPEDRARLASVLINSLDALEDVDQAAVDAAWAAEVRRRVEDLRTAKVSVLDGEQVFRLAREAARLDPTEEKDFAEEGMGADLDPRPDY
jgi:putative addiction module component (TIGR02574 family)